MRLTREKTIRLSHTITDLLVASDDVEFVEDRDTIRQKVVQILQDLLKEEEAMDAEVRKKISSQKKEILRGRDAPHGNRPPTQFLVVFSSAGFSLRVLICARAKVKRTQAEACATASQSKFKINWCRRPCVS